MKKAFTLIELLVVIAIIAILAAILFPVFAQAKVAAKKTQVLSNAKQYGTSINIYLADSDDVLPSAFGQRENGTLMAGVQHPYPANALADAIWGTDFRRQQAGNMVANSVQPYMKSLQIQEVVLATKNTIPTDIYSGLASASYGGLAFNGFLSTYNSTAVGAPSGVPLIWTAFGNSQVKNRVASSPSLACPLAYTPCQFNPGALPQPGASGAAYSWTGIQGYTKAGMIEGKGVFVRVDSSAKVQNLGSTAGDLSVPPGPATLASAYGDPFAKVGVGGDITGGAYITSCNLGGTTPNYWCYFRPDRDQ